MELSVGLPPGPDFADLAVLAEELGYSRVWIFDSAPQYEDPFVHLALAATRTSRVGFGTAVLIPKQRSLMAMASGIATIARLAPGRLRVCFGSGFTSMVVTGQKAMTQNALFEYVASIRALLAGETIIVDGAAQRMVHWKGLTADRPIDVPIWLSVFGPKGAQRAPEVAEGVVGPVHPTLPSATMASGTVLEPGESRAPSGCSRRSGRGECSGSTPPMRAVGRRLWTRCPVARNGARSSRHCCPKGSAIC
jgi:5,10-methylenetetrahydromethanopterin reductase